MYSSGMKQWFDWSDATSTFKSIVDIFVGIDIALWGAIQQWADVNIIVLGGGASLITIILFGHIKLFKEASIRTLVWITSFLLGTALMFYSFFADWWGQFEFWLRSRKMYDPSIERYLVIRRS